MTDQTILRLPHLIQRIKLSKTTIYQLIKDGELKAPISLGARAVGWLSSDVDEFLDARIKASRSDVE